MGCFAQRFANQFVPLSPAANSPRFTAISWPSVFSVLLVTRRSKLPIRPPERRHVALHVKRSTMYPQRLEANPQQPLTQVQYRLQNQLPSQPQLRPLQQRNLLPRVRRLRRCWSLAPIAARQAKCCDPALAKRCSALIAKERSLSPGVNQHRSQRLLPSPQLRPVWTSLDQYPQVTSLALVARPIFSDRYPRVLRTILMVGAPMATIHMAIRVPTTIHFGMK
jgi:hypothetical protein